MARFPRLSPLTLVGLAFLLLLGGFICWNLRPENDPRVEAIRQAGYPATLKELDTWYAHVPESRNAAVLLTKAFAQPGMLDRSSTRDVLGESEWVPTRGHLLNDQAKAELAAVFATNQTVLELLHSTTALTNSRFPLDLTLGFQTLVPHLAKVKAAVLMLTAEALLDASQGHNDETIAALQAAGSVANSIAQEPLLISQLVRIGCWAIISKRVELILNGTNLSDEQLSALQALFSDAEQPNAMARGLAGERASGLAIFTDSQFQSTSLGSSTPSLKDRLRTSLFISALKATGILRKDKAFYLDIMATNIAAAEAPFPDRITQASATGGIGTRPLLAAPSRMLIFSRVLLPALSRTTERDAEHVAHIRTAQTAIAIERFRRAHSNGLPADLHELVPAFLPSVPTDPYDGQSLRFKRLTSGYVVYSIGGDLHDDGGIEGGPWKKNLAKDITFILEK